MTDLKVWETRLENGEVIGRDPRTMSKDELEVVGHRPVSPLKALRLRCLDCCAGSDSEVRKCTARKCPSWPFRMGRNPWRSFTLSEKQRAVLDKLHGKTPVSDGE